MSDPKLDEAVRIVREEMIALIRLCLSTRPDFVEALETVLAALAETQADLAEWRRCGGGGATYSRRLAIQRDTAEAALAEAQGQLTYWQSDSAIVRAEMKRLDDLLLEWANKYRDQAAALERLLAEKPLGEREAELEAALAEAQAQSERLMDDIQSTGKLWHDAEAEVERLKAGWKRAGEIGRQNVRSHLEYQRQTGVALADVQAEVERLKADLYGTLGFIGHKAAHEVWRTRGQQAKAEAVQLRFALSLADQELGEIKAALAAERERGNRLLKTGLGYRVELRAEREKLAVAESLRAHEYAIVEEMREKVDNLEIQVEAERFGREAFNIVCKERAAEREKSERLRTALGKTAWTLRNEQDARRIDATLAVLDAAILAREE